MAKQKPAEEATPTPEGAATAPARAITVETNSAVEDANAAAEKASDPYGKEPKVEVREAARGVKVETFI